MMMTVILNPGWRFGNLEHQIQDLQEREGRGRRGGGERGGEGGRGEEGCRREVYLRRNTPPDILTPALSMGEVSGYRYHTLYKSHFVNNYEVYVTL